MEHSISQKGSPGAYSLGCPVPAWVGLHVVLHNITVERQAESEVAPGLFVFNICTCPTWTQRKEGRLGSEQPSWDLGEPGQVTVGQSQVLLWPGGPT